MDKIITSVFLYDLTKDQIVIVQGKFFKKKNFVRKTQKYLKYLGVEPL